MKIGDSQKGDGSSSPRAVMVERVAAFTGEVPKLSKVNYQEWALEMQVHLEGMEVWDAVETAAPTAARIDGLWPSSSKGCHRR